MSRSFAVLAAAVVVFGASACGAGSATDDESPTTQTGSAASSTAESSTAEPSTPPSPATSEEMSKLLECEVTRTPDLYSAYSSATCRHRGEGESGGVVYLYVFDTDTEAVQNAVERYRTERQEPDETRGIATANNWILDTDSPSAMEVAVEHGAEVIAPIG